jgi:hypothetical protein
MLFERRATMVAIAVELQENFGEIGVIKPLGC